MRLSLAFVLLVAFASTWPCLGNAPAFDDEFLIFNNPFVQSWDHLGENLTRDFFYTPSGAQIGYYRPLTKLAFIVQFGAFRNAVFGYHALSIATLLLAALLAYLVVLRVSGSRMNAALAAAFFACHPAQAGAASTIAPQSDLFVAVSVLAAFYAYLRFRESARGLWLAFSVSAAALALGCKELGVIVPLLVLAWELAEARGWPSRARLAPLAWFLLPLAGYALLRVVFKVLPIQGEPSALGDTLATAGKITLWGVARSVAPLAFIPELHTDRPAGDFLSIVLWLGPALLLAAASLAALLRLPRARLGLIFLGLPLVPLLSSQSLIHMSEHADMVVLPDRWLYLCAFGGSVLLAELLTALWQRSEQRVVRFALGAGALTLIVVQTLLSAEESASFATENARVVYIAEIFRSHGVYPRHSDDQLLAADAILADAKGDAAASVAAYEKLLARAPENSTALYNLAVAELRANQPQQALVHAYSAFHGRTPDGTRTFERNYTFDRRRPEKAFFVGQLLERLGDRAAARRYFELSLQLNPSFLPAQAKLAAR